MSILKISIWGEEIDLDRAFLELSECGGEAQALRELSKGLIFKRNFEKYELRIANPGALLSRFREAVGLTTEEALVKFLAKTGQSQESLMSKLVFQEQLSSLRNMIVTREAVSEAYLQNKAKFDGVTFRVIRLENEALAKEIYFKLHDDGEDFEALAKEHSTGPEAENGGLIGPRSLQSLNRELRTLLSNLQPGQTSEVFSLDSKQFLIVKLLEFHTAQLSPQLEKTLKEQLFESWVERQLSLAQVALVRKG